MTIQQLASLTNELFRQGKGDLPVYFREGPVSYPITRAQINVIGDTRVIQLYFDRLENGEIYLDKS